MSDISASRTVAANRLVFCGEEFAISAEPLQIGRSGDVIIDENPYLHRRFLTVEERGGIVWIHNVGTQLSATVADDSGLAQTWLSPGAQIPVVFPRSVVWFTAGPTTYDFEILIGSPVFTPTAIHTDPNGNTTIGQVGFTPDQKLLCVALAEEFLARGVEGRGSLPTSAAAANRLGWTLKKFERKLDNVCEKLARNGVNGLVGSAHSLASSRRSRLVEYVLASRLVVPADLALLEMTPPDPAQP